MAQCYDVTNVHLQGYADSDFTNDVDSRKSITSYVFTLKRGAVSWVSRLQKVVAFSMIEVEYVEETEACKELIWLKDFMKESGKEQVTLPMNSNSQSVINLFNNLVYHERAKRIGVVPLYPHSFKGWCVITGEDTHESESRRHADQSSHDGEAEDLLSLCGSSKVKICS